MSTKLATEQKKIKVGRIRQLNQTRILQAAEIEFALHGAAGTTVDSIAKRAKVPRTNIHYYFDNKQKLYEEILNNTLDLWILALNEMKAEDDPAEALSEYIRLKMSFSKKHPLPSKIFAREILSGAPHLKQQFGNEYHKWFKERAEVFNCWSKQGKITPIEPAHLLFLIWSSTQHYADFDTQVAAALGKNSLSANDIDAATQSLIHILLHGLLPR